MPDDTNPTQAVNEPNATPDAQTDGGQETFDAAYVQKLRQEAAANRIKAKEAQEALAAAKIAAERAKLDEVDRLKAEFGDLQAQLEKERAAARLAGVRADLTGHVADASAAMKLFDAERHTTDDGSTNVQAFLTDYPFMQQTVRATVNPSNPAGSPREGRPVTLEDFKGKTPDEARRLLNRYQEQRGEERGSSIFAGTKIKT